MTPYSLLTKNEKESVELYINEAANLGYDDGCFIGVKNYLSYWDTNKQFLLDNVFHGQLRVEFELDRETMLAGQEDARYILAGTGTQLDFDFEHTYDRAIQDCLNFWLRTHCFSDHIDPYGAATWLIHNCFNRRAFLDGITSDMTEWEHFGWEFNKSQVTGKQFILKGRWKVFKLLQKLIRLYGGSSDASPAYIRQTEELARGVEKLRLIQSQIKQASPKATKVMLSIHPLDFLSMSDNSLDWSSCMSLLGDGEYRNGAIEMMNSPVAVIASVNSSTPYYPIDDEHPFTNKIWRQLFIVDREAIISMKGYPYQMPLVSQAIIKKLYEMSGWKFKYDEVGPYREMEYFDASYLYDYEANPNIEYPGVLVNTTCYYNDFVSCRGNRCNTFFWIHDTFSKRIDISGPVPDCISGAILNDIDSMWDPDSYFDEKYDEAVRNWECERDFYDIDDDLAEPDYDDVRLDYEHDYLFDRFFYCQELTLE